MSNTTLKTRILLANKTTVEWGTTDTVILKGEPALEFLTTGEVKIKIGDGVKTFSALPYATMTPSEINTVVEEAVSSASHSHDNLEILKQITAAFTTELKNKLDDIEEGANKTVVDTELSDTSVNPVQNKVVKAELEKTKSALQSEIASAVANADHLKREIVETKPEAGVADEHTIYMVKKTSGSGEQQYDEYMLINGVLEKIGDSAVDLTNYAKKTEVDTKISDKVGEIGDKTVKQYVDEGRYTHPTGDGNLHVPTTGSTNKDKVLTAGSTPGELLWKDITKTTVGLDKVDNTSDAEKSVASSARLTNARNINVTGAVTATAAVFDGTGDANIQVTAVNASKLVQSGSDVLVLDGNSF